MGQDHSFRQILEAKYLAQIKEEAYRVAYTDALSQILGRDHPLPTERDHLFTELLTRITPARFVAPGHLSYARQRGSTIKTKSVGNFSRAQQDPARSSVDLGAGASKTEPTPPSEPLLQFSPAQRQILQRLANIGVELPEKITARGLKKIYRTSLRASHPDQFFADNPAQVHRASERFQELKEAWSLLYDSLHKVP